MDKRGPMGGGGDVWIVEVPEEIVVVVAVVSSDGGSGGDGECSRLRVDSITTMDDVPDVKDSCCSWS